MGATIVGDASTDRGNAAPVLDLDLLDALMAAKGVTTRAAQAQRFGVHRTHWVNIRNGAEPRLGTALRIAREAGTRVEALWSL